MPPTRSDLFDDPGLIGLGPAMAALGKPARVHEPAPLAEITSDGRHPFGSHRSAEVVMVLPRALRDHGPADGPPAAHGLLLHGKVFYPEGVLRLPSGGIREGEAILEAALREVREETGLSLAPSRFLFHHVHHLVAGGMERVFHSLGFLYPRSNLPVTPEDTEEQITGFTAVGWEEMPRIIERLETLNPLWRTWGEFRARGHRLLLEIRRKHPEWFRS